MANEVFYAFSAKHGKQEQYDFNTLRDKVVLIVNVASLCGFTPQYNDLQALYQKYHLQGFEILAFPCNQFGSQEPYDDEQIQKFVQSQFHVTFPVLSKVFVNGTQQDPIFHYLKSQITGPLGFHGVRWNFEKFLMDREGNVVGRYNHSTPPQYLEPAIVDLLNAKKSSL